MKTLKALLVLAFVGLAGTASAQFANSGSSASGSSIWTTVNTDGYNRVYVSYNPIKAKIDLPGEDDMKFQGFSVGYLRGIGLTQKLPLYLEVGAGLRYGRYKDDYSESGDDGYDTYIYTDEYKVTIFALNIPVSLVYRINVNEDFAISPNFGFDFRLNLSGKYKNERSVSYGGETESKSEDCNLFDDDEMKKAELGEGWKRFQAGWHIGVGFDYKALHFGVDYGTDFNEITEKTKVATTSVTVGYNF